MQRALETLARIEAIAQKITDGVELFDPDTIGHDLLRQVDELAELMSALDADDPSDSPQ